MPEVDHDHEKMGFKTDVPVTHSLACYNLVMHISYEQRDYWLGFAYINNYDANTDGWISLDYPQLNPKARLRVNLAVAERHRLLLTTML